ncbi:hypothetical protein C8R43DRAFT_1156330 [Mycena crocata]|nr:hypothetical protein C8R43DRAFT_1156330 [Mycena crocata]
MDDEAISNAQAIITENYCHIFGMALLFWDHLITIDAEAQYLWRRPKSSGAYLFFVVRYGALTSNIPIISYVWIATFPKEFKWTCIDLAAIWGTVFVFDALIFILTIFNAYLTRRRLGIHAEANMPIHTLIVHDGAMYFAAMALANLANISTFAIHGHFVPGSLATFATGVSVTMVSRLMLNIHETAAASASSPTHLSMSISQEGGDVTDVAGPNNHDASLPQADRDSIV